MTAVLERMIASLLEDIHQVGALADVLWVSNADEPAEGYTGTERAIPPIVHHCKLPQDHRRQLGQARHAAVQLTRRIPGHRRRPLDRSGPDRIGPSGRRRQAVRCAIKAFEE